MDLGLTKKAVALKLKKMALEIREPEGALGATSSGIAKTVGRLAAFPKSVLVGQERFLDYLTDYDKKELADQLKDFKKDPRFRDTVVRLAHSDLTEDYDRLAKSEDLGPITKTIGKAVLPIAALSTSLRRSTHYNPFSDTISVYGRSPEIIKQEFLRALKYKKDPSDKDLINIAKGQLLDPKNPSSNPEEYRRRTWPLNAGLWGGLLAGLATLHPDVRNYADEQLSGLNVTDSDLLNKIIRKGALGLGAVGSGALLGRAAAETTNIMNKNTKQAFINGFVKRANQYGFSGEDVDRIIKLAVGESGDSPLGSYTWTKGGPPSTPTTAPSAIGGSPSAAKMPPQAGQSYNKPLNAASPNNPQGPNDAFIRKTMGSYDKNSAMDRAKADRIRSLYAEGKTSPNAIYNDATYRGISTSSYQPGLTRPVAQPQPPQQRQQPQAPQQPQQAQPPQQGQQPQQAQQPQAPQQGQQPQRPQAPQQGQQPQRPQAPQQGQQPQQGQGNGFDPREQQAVMQKYKGIGQAGSAENQKFIQAVNEARRSGQPVNLMQTADRLFGRGQIPGGGEVNVNDPAGREAFIQANRRYSQRVGSGAYTGTGSNASGAPRSGGGAVNVNDPAGREAFIQANRRYSQRVGSGAYTG